MGLETYQANRVYQAGCTPPDTTLATGTFTFAVGDDGFQLPPAPTKLEIDLHEEVLRLRRDRENWMVAYFFALAVLVCSAIAYVMQVWP
jgi:hypothetical protein